MKTFKDNADRTWTLAINIDAVKRVRSMLQIDLLTIVDGKLAEKLLLDHVVLVDVVYVICKPNADKLGVSDEEFGRAMAGDAIADASAALIEELADFFPIRQRTPLKAALAKAKEADAEAMRLATEKIQAIDIGQMVRQTFGN